MLGQLEARLKMMSGGSKLCSHREASTTLQEGTVQIKSPRARRQAISLAHLLWEHDFGHREATMLGQLEARMKMMSEESKLCSHHRLGVSKTLPEGKS